jgi:preprotein translocase subunit YajC
MSTRSQRHIVRFAPCLAMAFASAAVLSSINPAAGAATTRKTTKKTTAKAKTTTPSSVKISAQTTFRADVWADNWFSMSVNGKKVGEDSVPITTERSFNAETFTFTASYPLTIAVQAKDYKETDSGLEYIGQGNQQMGDGGLIVQITNVATGKVVAVTDSSWKSLVIQRAPLNPTCEKDAEPDKTCKSESVPEPAGWTTVGFHDSSWTPATVWSADAVGPKGGYTGITWNPKARFIWGTELHIDNTVLLRFIAKSTTST